MFTLAFRIQPVKAQPTTIIVPDDYPTIQGALNAASYGDTIFVRNGTYSEHINIYKPITLVGEDRNTTIIDGNGTGTVINIDTDDVRILNFTIRNSGPLFSNNGTIEYNALIYGPTYDDVDIENNTLLNAGTAAITFGGSYSININNNFISNVSYFGIDVGNPTLSETYNVTVSNNTVRDNGVVGISFDGDTENSTIENNSVEDCTRGIALGPNDVTHLVPSNNLFEENLLSNNSVANLLIASATSRTQSSYMNTFRKNNLTNTLAPNIIIWGSYLGVFNQDIDTSNTANNRTIYYITNQSNVQIDPSSYGDARYLALVNCTNVTASDFDLSGNIDGMLLAGVTNSTLTNMTLGNNHPTEFQLVTVSGPISGPVNWGGLTLFESSNNTITNSKIYNNTVGVSFYQSDDNMFFHNSFINDYMNVLSNFTGPAAYAIASTVPVSTNLWDNGYPSGGNYWSDYLTKYPNATETNSSGVWNTPYVIDANNTDNYPLTVPYATVPEFPSFLLLPLFMITTLLAVIIYKKKAMQYKRL